jgi:hypothetical protein
LHQTFRSQLLQLVLSVRSKQRSALHIWKRVKQLFAPALFLLWFGLLVYLPYFRVTKVVFYGLQILKKEEMQQYLTSTVLNSKIPFFPGNNYFFVSPDTVETELQNKFAVSAVTVTKVFPNEIHVEIQEKISSMIYENNKQFFLLDQGGTIIKFLGEETPAGFSTSTDNDPLVDHTSIGISAAVTSSTTLADTTVSTSPKVPLLVSPNYLKIRNLFGGLPLLLDSSFVSSTTNETSIVPPGSIRGALDFQDLLQKGGVTTVKYFELQDAGGGLAVHTSQPWIIYFQPKDDLQAQLNNLKMILQSNRPSQYVDLRYGERVYWK